MPIIQIPIDSVELCRIQRIKDKQGHTWIKCLRLYAELYKDSDK